MFSHIERPFLDLISGAIGVLALFIVIFLLSSWHNAKIILKIRASTFHGKYPIFVICEKHKNSSIGYGILVCNKEYLPNKDLKMELNKMCEYLEIEGLNEVSPKESWDLFEDFITKRFLKNKFYIFVLIRPSGVSIFKRKLDPLLREHKLSMGFMPIPEDWDFSISLIGNK